MIDAIFPTPIYNVTLDSHKKWQDLFLPFLDDMSIWSDKNSWDCSVQTSLDSGNNHKLLWNDISEEIIPLVKDYASIWEPITEYDIGVESWMCKYSTGSYQEQHNHISSRGIQLSAVYMLSTKQTDSKLVFVDPSQDFYKQSGFSDFFYNTPQRCFVPVQPEGTFLIFPSNLDHYVTANTSNNIRATLSMNFKFIWKIEQQFQNMNKGKIE